MSQIKYLTAEADVTSYKKYTQTKSLQGHFNLSEAINIHISILYSFSTHNTYTKKNFQIICFKMIINKCTDI